ncbi:hypothetical protein RND81_07G196100 [Saponaria officinalis]|uniref:Uncharacterized protein n=1 Tax=Saponaria officinalis TaxID=3572 RepID=A0AAW1JSD7_SAPOF
MWEWIITFKGIFVDMWEWIITFKGGSRQRQRQLQQCRSTSSGPPPPPPPTWSAIVASTSHLPPPAQPPSPAPAPGPALAPAPAPAQIPITFYHAAMIWPPAFCTVVRCVRRPDYAFRMHGLWPTNLFGLSPKNCGRAYDESQMPRFQTPRKCWIGFSVSNEDLWEQQWRKHGSCGPLTQESYFRRGHSVCDALSRDLMDALSRRRITPGQDHAISAYYSAIYDLQRSTAGNLKLQQAASCFTKSGFVTLYRFRGLIVLEGRFHPAVPMVR